MIYQVAAKYLESGAGSLRNRVYKENSKDKARHIYALVSETLKYKQVLSHVIKTSHLLDYEKRLPRAIAMLMVHDLLISKSKRIMCGKCAEKDAVLRHKTRLNGELVKFKVKHGSLKAETDQTPVRWVRCNFTKATPQVIEEMFKSAGLTQVETFAVHEKAWFKDPYVDGLYGIHPTFPVIKTDLYKNGSLIIQDRASCFPVAIMNPDNTRKYIDACSAPGNKTTLLAASAEHVDAFERDKKRALTLQKMIKVAGLSDRVTVLVQDFTKADPQDYPDIAGLIVDPSCSGSGIFGRDSLDSKKEDESRLLKLAEFQYIIMSHALQFNAETVVYSTCSIHAQENEQVVRRLLETPSIAERWQLRERNLVLPTWPRRGLESEFTGMEDAPKLADSCVRVLPQVDGGIGFFAACFERKQ